MHGCRVHIAAAPLLGDFAGMHHDGAGAGGVVEGMRAPWDMRRRHSGDGAEKARCGALGQSDVRDGDEADVVPWVGMRRTTMKRRVRKLADSEGVRGYDVAKRWSGYSMGRNEGSRLPSKRLLRKRASCYMLGTEGRQI